VSQNLYGLVLAGIAGVSGGGVTWLVARMKNSGRIATSDADRLWDENTKIRTYLTAEVDGLRTSIVRLEKQAVDDKARIGTLEGRVEELERANVALVAENSALKASR
jgi:hypothetical protein